MKLRSLRPAPPKGYALILVLATLVVGMLILGSAMKWTTSNSIINARNNQYYESLYAAEAATEKVIARMLMDFRNGGQSLVFNNVSAYATNVPLGTENAFFASYVFGNDAQMASRVTVTNLVAWSTNAVALDSQYAGLYGLASTYRIVSHARRGDARYDLTASVAQDVQVATIPLFQYAIFFDGTGEVSCNTDTIFNVRGKVHSNKDIYFHPDGQLHFWDDVTSVGNAFTNKKFWNGTTTTGTVNFHDEQDTGVAGITLPIGTNALPTILDAPPTGESATSGMGTNRFYNKADLILTVTNVGGSNVVFAQANAGGTLTLITNGVPGWATVGSSFYDNRETKTVKPVNINVAAFTKWNNTNSQARAALTAKTGGDVTILFVQDKRTGLSSSELGAVRLTNGAVLPTRGLTIATPRPVYVQGHYNVTNTAHYGTDNTSSSRPAAIVADAVNVLSTAWTDSNSTNSLASRVAAHTTVNAALLAGSVPSYTNQYSGGAENFPRYHETWTGTRTNTVNGSMVILFASRFATNVWGKGNVYGPPSRNFNFDTNYLNATKLPPGTPAATAIIRSQWQPWLPKRPT